MRKVFSVLSLSFRSFKDVYIFSRYTVLFSTFVLIVTSINTYFNVYLSKLIVDTLFDKDLKVFYVSLVSMVIIQIFSNYFTSLSLIKNFQLSNAFNNRSDEEMIDKIQSIDLIHKENPKFNADLSYLQYIKGKTYELYIQFKEFILKIITLFIGIHFLFDVDLLFCVLAVSFGVIKGLFNVKPIKSRVKITEELQRDRVKYTYLYDLLISMVNQKELMIYRVYNHFKQKWKLQKEEYDQKQLQLEKINRRISAQQDFLMVLFNGIVIILFASLMTYKQLTMGDYLLITMAVSLTITNISLLIGDYARMYENSIHFSKISEEDSFYSDYLRTNKDGEIEFQLSKSIEVKNLSFVYPNSSKEVLNDISLKINKGETVAILGENGSGKTTLAKILLGLYGTSHNHVYIDEIPMSLINKESVFRKTSVVFQDFIKYQTTLQDNIGISDIDNYQNENRMISALKIADIKALGHDLQTKLGIVFEGAVNLSGGQWQRLAIARFFFKENPDLAVFDEATSALDPLTEMRIFKDILSYCEDLTTIIISHRVGIARKADKVIVMENGRIIEQGTHKELIAQKNVYYHMWISQREWYQDDEEVSEFQYV